ncbi:MAG: dihydroorotate dehydrogenase, partial [Candidatus Omnitrophica bacterium]|nr:dihydroorotate dehydrogenase [Candidatus Omnitrophota bacterium]
PVPRTCETPAGMLNSIGLENPGIDAFIHTKLPLFIKIGVPIIVSIASETSPREFVSLAERLDSIPEVAGIELNISCPNLKDGKSRQASHALIAQDARATQRLVRMVRKATKKVLITKLSPNVTCITDIAEAAQDAGSDALSLINTLTAMGIDVVTRSPKIAAVTAGLSGPAIRPVALRMVWEVYNKVKIPLIGMGGITDTASALEFFIAGARAISVGTGNFVNPNASVEIVDGIRQYLEKNNLRSVKKLVGSLLCKL